MTEIEFTEVDDKYVDERSQEVSLSTGLYDFECTECGGQPMMVLDPDADGPSWNGECCGNRYHIYVSKVRIEKSDTDL